MRILQTVTLTILLVLAALAGPMASADLLCEDVRFVNAESTSSSMRLETTESSLCLKDGDGGGGGTYQSSWNGETYDETLDPLARFVHFPVSSTDSRGLVTLTSLPYLPRHEPVWKSLDHLTNADIAQAMQLLNVTNEDLIAEVTNLYGNDEEMNETLAITNGHLAAGEYVLAKAEMWATYANVTYWCGPAELASPVRWVLVIPAIVQCGDEGTVEEAVVSTRVPNAPRYYLNHETETSPLPPRADASFWIAEINLSTTVAGVSTGNTPRLAAVTYANYTWSGNTSLDKVWTMDTHINRLDSQRHRFGYAYWNGTELARFGADDAVSFIHGANPYGADVVSARILDETATFRVDYKTDANDAMRYTWIKYQDSSRVKETEVVLRFPEDHQFQFVLANQTDGISARQEVGNVQDRLKRTVTFGSVNQSAFRDTELKGSYFVDATPVLDLQLKGLPGEESTTEQTLPNSNQLRLDFGSEGDGFSFDLTKNASLGYYRSVVLTSNVSAFPFQATANHVGRVRYVGGAQDPWLTEPQPYVIHSVNLEDRRGNSTLATTAGFPVVYEGKWDADVAGSEKPTQQRWWFNVNASCGANCTDWIDKRTNASRSTEGASARFWAVGDFVASEDPDTQLSPHVCAFRRASGACP